jgi:hypothetical protein
MSDRLAAVVAELVEVLRTEVVAELSPTPNAPTACCPSTRRARC